MYQLKLSLASLILIVLLYNCEKSDNIQVNPRLIDTTWGGCAVGNQKSATLINILQNQVTYTFKNNELNLLVVFEGTCCNTILHQRPQTILFISR